jgi:hypothetical protein
LYIFAQFLFLFLYDKYFIVEQLIHVLKSCEVSSRSVQV